MAKKKSKSKKRIMIELDTPPSLDALDEKILSNLKIPKKIPQPGDRGFDKFVDYLTGKLAKILHIQLKQTKKNGKRGKKNKL